LEELAGKTFAVTGGSKGMGLAFVRALAREGARVAILARPRGRWKRLAGRSKVRSPCRAISPTTPP
jgi:NAD(P)-dependent dehydrogenase (short-subunit alcohol dehydrogenase family)